MKIAYLVNGYPRTSHGSVFPTSSQANPTLTIIAMALRLARQVAALEDSSRATVRIESARPASSRVGT